MAETIPKPGTAETFNIFAQPGFLDDPWPHYERLRAIDPLHKSEVGWIALGYEDCREFLHTGRTRQADPTEWQMPLDLPGRNELQDTVREWIGMSNPPAHRQRRALIEKAFMRQSVEKLKHIVHQCIDELLSEAERQGGMDFVGDFAYPLPANVICTMLGVPQSDRDLLRHWAHDVSVTYDPGTGEELLRAGIKSAEQCQDYFQAAIAERRVRPREDLLTLFAQVQDGGTTLTPHEIAANALLVFVAGHDTTAGVLGNGVLELYSAHNAETLGLMKAERDAVMDAAVEEIMRFGGSVHTIWRVADQPIEQNGRQIAKDDLIVVCLAAANRDLAVYPDPYRFDVRRQAPRQHLGFGFGAHLCIGRLLARMEIASALNALFDRAPGMRLATERPPIGGHIAARSPASLPVTF
jgi:pimeloyl-[acyl-carrier protein] synthase